MEHKNRHETPKQRAVAHEGGSKRQNTDFWPHLDSRAQGSLSIKNNPGPQNSALWTTKLAQKDENNEFFRHLDSRAHGSWSIKNRRGTPNQVYPTKLD